MAKSLAKSAAFALVLSILTMLTLAPTPIEGAPFAAPPGTLLD